jgi:hypothetical protein
MKVAKMKKDALRKKLERTLREQEEMIKAAVEAEAEEKKAAEGTKAAKRADYIGDVERNAASAGANRGLSVQMTGAGSSRPGTAASRHSSRSGLAGEGRGGASRSGSRA